MLVRGRDVLDVACGEGYGCALIAQISHHWTQAPRSVLARTAGIDERGDYAGGVGTAYLAASPTNKFGSAGMAEKGREAAHVIFDIQQMRSPPDPHVDDLGAFTGIGSHAIGGDS
jgi:hypothetical protein